MRGGRRPGAGRKLNPQVLRARALIKAAVPDKAWLQIFHGLATTAMAGDKGAAQCAGLLMRYGFGLPQADSTGDDQGKPSSDQQPNQQEPVVDQSYSDEGSTR